MASGFTMVERGLKVLSGLVTGPLGLMSVPKNHVVVIQRFGKIDRVIDHGLRWAPLGAASYDIFMGVRTYKFDRVPMIDATGTPILCSAVMNYKVKNPADFVINLDHDNQTMNDDNETSKKQKKVMVDSKAIIYNIAEGVMRDNFRALPLNSGKNNIRDSSAKVADNIVSVTNQKVSVFGVELDNFIITDVNYAPEVMQQMLMKQQAQAYVDARQELVNGVVGIINNTVEKMPHLTPEVRDKITVNLFTTLTSNNGAHAVVNTN